MIPISWEEMIDITSGLKEKR